jgi:hypothetical protein
LQEKYGFRQLIESGSGYMKIFPRRDSAVIEWFTTKPHRQALLATLFTWFLAALV